MRKKPSRRPHKPERDRAIHEVLVAIKGIPATQIAAKTWVSHSTISRWRNGQTRYPSHTTLEAVARTVGLEFKLVRSNMPFDYETEE